MKPNDQQVLNWYNEFFRSIDLETEIKKLLYDGFDNYEDYKKYGDLFVEVKKEVK